MRRGLSILVGGLIGGVVAACGLGLVGAEPPAGAVPDASSTSGSDGASPDGAPSDGGPTTCVADLTSDPANCGACGHDCLGGACIGGACQPVVFASGEHGVTGVTVIGAALYWTREGDGLVRTAPLAGGAPTTLLDGTTNFAAPASPSGIGTDGTSLFVTDRTWSEISSWSVAGAEIWTRSPFVTPTGITADDAGVFVALQSQDTIVGTKLDGKSPVDRMTNLNYPAGVALAGGRIFASSGSGILVAPADGGVPVTTVSPTSRFQDGGGDLIHTGLTVDGATVWFTVGSLGIVATVPASGGTAKVLASQQSDPVGITVSPSAIYWANRGANAIMKLAR